MSLCLGGLLTVLLLVVGLLTGILAIAREVQMMYHPVPAPSKKVFWGFVRIAFVLSAGLLLMSEHSKLGEEHSGREEVKQKLANEEVNHQGCEVSLRKTQDSLNVSRGTLDERSTRISNQQASLGECLVQLGKAQQAEPLRTTVHRVHPRVATSRDPKIAAYSNDYVLLTNRTVTPVRALIVCTTDIVSADRWVLGASSLSCGDGRVVGKNAQIAIDSPAWTPTNPIFITVYTNVWPFNCGFRFE